MPGDGVNTIDPADDADRTAYDPNDTANRLSALMVRRSTERLPVALLTCAIAVIVAILIGQPAVVMLATPWFVLLSLGLSSARRQDPSLAITVDNDRVMVDDPLEVSAEISGANGRLRVVSDPKWRFGSVDHPAAAAESDVAVDGEATTLTFSVPAEQWGTFDVGRVQAEVIEPYGLTRWIGSLTDLTPIRVHPTPRQIKSMVGPRFVRRTSGAHGSRLAERGVEYADLRQFGPGDSLRDINWRVSARSPELWVSQRHPDRATDVVLLLDSFVESGHDAATVVGLAIEAAVAVAESHLAVTDQVGLVELGGLVRWVVPGTGALQLQRLVDALLATGLYASSANRDLAVISPRALPPRSLVIALSPLLDQRFIDALLTLAGRGHDIAVIECDPATQPPTTDNSCDEPLATLGWRMWQAERAVMRDELTKQQVAVARWDANHPIDGPMQELIRRRARARGTQVVGR